MSLVNTRIQNIRAKSNLDKNEIRPSRYGALDLFKTQSDNPAGILTPELKEKAAKSIGSTLQTPVIDFDGAISIGNTRTVTIADSENTSQMVDITFTTYAWGFTQVPALFHNNEIGEQADFEAKFMQYLNKFAATLDTAALTALSTAKTQVFGDLLTYTETGNVVIVPFSQRESSIGDTNVMMGANDYFGDLHIVGNGGVESTIRKMAESGLYNAENKTMQYSDKTLHFTPRLANGVDEFANMYAVEGGSVAVLPRFEVEALRGTKTKDGHEWGIETLPMINFPIGTYEYESVSSQTTIAGAASAHLDRVLKKHYGFAVDVAFLTAYNSDIATKANPIMKFTIASKAVSDALAVNIVNTAADPVNTLEVTP